jgi:hypothetical protein
MLYAVSIVTLLILIGPDTVMSPAFKGLSSGWVTETRVWLGPVHLFHHYYKHMESTFSQPPSPP